MYNTHVNPTLVSVKHNAYIGLTITIKYTEAEPEEDPEICDNVIGPIYQTSGQ